MCGMRPVEMGMSANPRKGLPCLQNSESELTGSNMSCGLMLYLVKRVLIFLMGLFLKLEMKRVAGTIDFMSFYENAKWVREPHSTTHLDRESIGIHCWNYSMLLDKLNRSGMHTNLSAVFATGESVEGRTSILPGANGRRTGKTVGPTTSFQNVSECEARQIPTDPHRSPQIPTNPH